MVCEEFRAHLKNTLQGFATLRLPSGLRVFGCTLHEKSGRQWVSMPARPYKDENGDTKWTPVIDFVNQSVREKFSSAAVAAITRYISEHPELSTETAREEPAADTGF
jgi:hypothetical protein